MTIWDKNIFLDIWWHVGTYSIRFINHNKNKNVKVYCFEPHPETYKILNKNIELNNLKDIVIPINKWVFSRTTTVKFIKNLPKDAAVSKIVEDENKNTIDIETISIDDFIEQYSIEENKIWFIKIDVEGLELQVLKWMEGFLKKTKRIKIVCEILNEEKQVKVFKYLEKFRFKVEKIDNFNYLFYK